MSPRVRKVFLRLVVVAALRAGAAAADCNLIANGYFSSGLESWSSTGGIAIVLQGGLLYDASPVANHLFQEIPMMSTLCRLEFDFRNLLEAETGGGASPDTFFATLYYQTNAAPFASGNPGLTSLALFDMDYSGVYNLDGTVGPSSKGPEWLHYSRDVETEDRVTIPFFEVFDFDGVSGNGSVLINNVTLVPMAASVITVAVGAYAHIEACGVYGLNYTVYAATGLAHAAWSPIGTASPSINGVMQFDDANATNYPARFYRIDRP